MSTGQIIRNRNSIKRILNNMNKQASMIRTTQQSIPISTVTAVNFTSVNGSRSDWCSTTTDLITPTVPGIYLVTFWVQWAAGSTGQRYHNHGGTAVALSAFTNRIVPINQAETASIGLYRFDGTTTIGLRVFQTEANPHNLNNAYLTVVKL